MAEKLLAGKYKTPEELEKAYQESIEYANKLKEINDSLSASLSAIQLEMEQIAKPPENDQNLNPPLQNMGQPKSDSQELELDKPLTRKEFLALLEQQEQLKQQVFKKQKELYDRFWNTYKDLEGFEDIVKIMTEQVYSDEKYIRELQRGETKQAYEEIAKRARQRIAEIKKSKVNMPVTMPPGNNTKETTATKEPEHEKAVYEIYQERVKNFEKKRAI